MLSIQTIQPDTLELLKRLSAFPELSATRLVGDDVPPMKRGKRARKACRGKRGKIYNTTATSTVHK